MGSVIKRQLKGGPAWYIIFRMNGKQKWERVPPEYTGKRGALRFLGERESQRDMIVAGQITFEQSASTWLEATKTRVKPPSWEHYDVALRNHLLPEFGSRQIQGLRPADIQQFVTKKCTRLSVSYVRDAVVFVLRNILDLAVQHEQLSRSPVPRRLIYPRQEKKRMGSYSSMPIRCSGRSSSRVYGLGCVSAKCWPCAGSTWTWRDSAMKYGRR